MTDVPVAQQMQGDEDSLESEGDDSAKMRSDKRRANRRDFEMAWRRLMSNEIKVEEIGEMMQWLPKLRSKFGRLKQELSSKAVASKGPAAPDLLPISIDAVLSFQEIWNRKVRAWCAFMVWCLNYFFCAAFDSRNHFEHPSQLTAKQQQMLRTHLVPAIERLLEGRPYLPSKQELSAEMDKKGQGYDGSTWVVMEQLEAEKVLPCWPDRGQAAVQPIAAFLKGISRDLLEAPMRNILPFEEWPEEIPKSYVRASDQEWERIVTAGFERGLFHHCPEEEILTGPDGRKVLNGAGGVPKEKDGNTFQRFISIFCPLNAVSRKIEGEEGTLPYVGQVSLLHIPDEECLVIDSEDLQSAFNLFAMPLGWRGCFCYEKQVPGRALGLDHDKPTYVALRTVPMGWISAVGVVQAAIRFLAFDVAGLPEAGELQKHKETSSCSTWTRWISCAQYLEQCWGSPEARSRETTANLRLPVTRWVCPETSPKDSLAPLRALSKEESFAETKEFLRCT